MRIRRELDERLSGALTELVGRDAPAIVRNTTDAKFGDYQANGVMGQAKRDKANPRDLAQKLVEKVRPVLADMCDELEIAGPGFINLRLSDSFLADSIYRMAIDERLSVPPVEKPKTVVIDFSSPNVAKPLHVGHLRSTILGDAIVRLLEFVGHNAIGDNHVGDWGTQFGMLIVGYRNWGDAAALAEHPTQELERVYRLTNDAAKENAAVADQARAELAKLQAGDEANMKLWEEFIAASRAETQRIYNRLNVNLTEKEWRGESFYHEMLGPLVEKLQSEGIAREDQGAMLIYFDDIAELADKPFMVRKSDGAFNYATTDLATIRYRIEQFKADEMVYVVDKRQSLHFKQLFSAAKRIGWDRSYMHVSFGAILGPDGRPIKTREGGTVRLTDLIDESVERARKIIEEKNPELTETERAAVAEMVGIGAVKYADLSQNRNSDYRFDWDKLLAFDGNTAPYMQYVYTRIQSIFRKMELPFDLAALDAQPVSGFEHESEKALAKELARLADVLHDVLDDYTPHILTDYLFNLAQAFNGFYRDCPVGSATGETRNRRLLLCWNTARQIKLGLNLLGIEAPERM